MSKTAIAKSSANPDSAISSRLVVYLTGLTDASITLSHQHFVEKLARLVDLSEAISLSETLRALPKMDKRESADQTLDLKDEFLRLRRERVAFIGRSFASADEDVPFILPTPQRAMLDDPVEGFQPYRRFYSLHQSEMDHQVLQLRSRVRQQLSARSPRLARLAALDSSVGDTLAAHNRQLFAQIAKLLGRRFRYLGETLAARQTEPDEWGRPGGWLAAFHQEMQGLLLAELDVRLLPVLGLVEAAEAEIESLVKGKTA